MNFIAIIFSFLIPTLSGFLFVSWLLGEKSETSLIERIILGFGIGMGLVTYEIFLMGVVGIPFSLSIIAAGQVIFSLLMIFLIYYSGRQLGSLLSRAPGSAFFDGAARPRGLYLFVSIFLLGWIAIKVVLVFHEGMTRPMFSWDTWANWAAGAKFFFYQKGLFLERGSEHFFGDGYRAFLGHPLHTTLLQVWTALWLGEFHEAYVKLWNSFYFLATLGLFFFFLKRESSWFYALLMTFFLSTIPLLTFHGTSGYAELPLAFYSLVAALLFFRYMKSADRGLLALSGVSLAMGIMTKNEGLFFVVAVGFTLFLFLIFTRRKFFANILWFVLPFVIFSAPWFIFKRVYGLGFGHSGDDSSVAWLADPNLEVEAGRSLYWEVFPALFESVFLSINFNLLFLFSILFTLLGLRTILISNLKYLYVIIIVVIAQFLFVYLAIEMAAVTEFTGVFRNMLTFISIIFFTSALVLHNLMTPNGAEHRGT
jgi:hypothetical protein